MTKCPACGRVELTRDNIIDIFVRLEEEKLPEGADFYDMATAILARMRGEK